MKINALLLILPSEHGIQSSAFWNIGCEEHNH